MKYLKNRIGILNKIKCKFYQELEIDVKIEKPYMNQLNMEIDIILIKKKSRELENKSLRENSEDSKNGLINIDTIK
jgi:hypothetical protein